LVEHILSVCQPSPTWNWLFSAFWHFVCSFRKKKNNVKICQTMSNKHSVLNDFDLSWANVLIFISYFYLCRYVTIPRYVKMNCFQHKNFFRDFNHELCSKPVIYVRIRSMFVAFSGGIRKSSCQHIASIHCQRIIDVTRSAYINDITFRWA
jgi:hypothetical protein